MPSVILKITITPQSVIMNTTQNAIDANFSQNYFVKLGQLLAVLTVAQKNETRWSMKSQVRMPLEIKLSKILMRGQC